MEEFSKEMLLEGIEWYFIALTHIQIVITAGLTFYAVHMRLITMQTILEWHARS